MTKKSRSPGHYKILLSLVFPNTASTKAGTNLVVLDYNAEQSGLNWETMHQPINNFKISAYFFIMVYGFVAQVIIALLFKKYGSLP